MGPYIYAGPRLVETGSGDIKAVAAAKGIILSSERARFFLGSYVTKHVESAVAPGATADDGGYLHRPEAAQRRNRNKSIFAARR
jgi:hypothetical protein